MTSSDNPKQHSFDLDPSCRETENKKGNESLIEATEESVNIVEGKDTVGSVDTPEKSSDKSELESPIESVHIPTGVRSFDDAKSNPPHTQESAKLSDKETREMVTPYAFTVSPELLGQSLATPTRRGVAMMIDVFLIAVLSGLSALLFAGFVAMTFFKAGDRLKQQKRFNFTRLTLRASAACLLFFIIFAIISDMGEPDEPVLTEAAQRQENKETMESLLDLAAALIDVSCKENSECLLKYAEGVAISAAAMEIPVEDINATTSDIVSQKEWSDEKKSLFMDKFVNTLNEERNAYTDDILKITQAADAAEQTSAVYSVIELVKGIMSDLGLGLGWAALYFSVFTAWWRGQTIGKKVVGIEVVKLDGNYPSLWESFGRYGGYGAGFATGLLGFLQIYWDPNRQAIQDKISETLVLRLKPNVKKHF
ncbi:RDD family protein [Brumicola pallidula]|jgi:hypothetical protein|uniref:RDD domain-containing protein n=1 Tax=Brumicola pallidula DSM 14239 = ACAM 615 TaxID=1121922 RepID=K7A024_9ALTE|nr:RDD family protein [Glaciecola pallidula]GAC28860.1 hypothetical protein GPAL_1999 [Glaciecola pallidula DSM 14239 = ACAM 615]